MRGGAKVDLMAGNVRLKRDERDGASGVAMRPHHKKGVERREAILDAAETVLARDGYSAASLREISDVAATNIGLINYYFRTKESLCLAVLERRRSEFIFRIISSLEEARARPDASVRSITRAYIEPMVRMHQGRAEGWRNYVRLTARFMLATHQPEIKEAMASLEPGARFFMMALRDVIPAMTDETFYAGMYVVEATLTYMLQDPTLLDRRSLGIHSTTRLEAFLDDLTPALAAAFSGEAA